MMNPNKPLKISKKERRQRMELKPGEVLPFAPHERPQFDARRMVYKLRCENCNFAMKKRLYVCPQCGTCQACGGQNIAGELNQACRFCGNGGDAPKIKPPTINSNLYASDHQHKLEQRSIEYRQPRGLRRSDKAAASESLHLQNPFS